MDELLSSNIDNSFPEVSSYEDYEDAKVSTIWFDIMEFKNGYNPLILIYYNEECLYSC